MLTCDHTWTPLTDANKHNIQHKSLALNETDSHKQKLDIHWKHFSYCKETTYKLQGQQGGNKDMEPNIEENNKPIRSKRYSVNPTIMAIMRPNNWKRIIIKVTTSLVTLNLSLFHFSMLILEKISISRISRHSQ